MCVCVYVCIYRYRHIYIYIYILLSPPDELGPGGAHARDGVLIHTSV